MANVCAFDGVLAQQTLRALAMDQLLAARIAPHLRRLLAAPELLPEAVARAEAAARAVPAAWIDGARADAQRCIRIAKPSPTCFGSLRRARGCSCVGVGVCAPPPRHHGQAAVEFKARGTFQSRF